MSTEQTSIRVVKRERGCVTLSDGRRIKRLTLLSENWERWAVEIGSILHFFRTLRDALKAAGVSQ